MTLNSREFKKLNQVARKKINDKKKKEEIAIQKQTKQVKLT